MDLATADRALRTLGDARRGTATMAPKLADRRIGGPVLTGRGTKDLQPPRIHCAVVFAVAGRVGEHEVSILMSPLFTVDVPLRQMLVKECNELLVAQVL